MFWKVILLTQFIIHIYITLNFRVGKFAIFISFSKCQTTLANKCLSWMCYHLVLTLEAFAHVILLHCKSQELSSVNSSWST